ncbi:phage terminase small subunit [Providencia sp. wls1950]|uniref:phage terminase small subunit n=1 Tax=Providencia sp. wls1950 TaxID=2675147 RepID=UPI0018A77568|nr:phage terminase small subunit [Providencia sp. wls1950]
MEHLTPAQQHWQKVMASRRGGASAEMSRADMTAYENILHRLRADQAQLSNIQGNDRKAAYKHKVLPNYRGWIEGVLESQSGVADEVFTRTLVWHIDAGLYTEALHMAEYAIQFNLPLPDNYNRTLATVLVDEICDWSLAVKASGKEDEVTASLDDLLKLERITAQSDMPDGARAKLYKVIGLTLKNDDKQQALALEYLQKAILIDKDIGVKKEIEQLLRAVRKQEDETPKK